MGAFMDAGHQQARCRRQVVDMTRVLAPERSAAADAASVYASVGARTRTTRPGSSRQRHAAELREDCRSRRGAAHALSAQPPAAPGGRPDGRDGRAPALPPGRRRSGSRASGDAALVVGCAAGVRRLAASVVRARKARVRRHRKRRAASVSRTRQHRWRARRRSRPTPSLPLARLPPALRRAPRAGGPRSRSRLSRRGIKASTADREAIRRGQPSSRSPTTRRVATTCPGGLRSRVEAGGGRLGTRG